VQYCKVWDVSQRDGMAVATGLSVIAEKEEVDCNVGFVGGSET
jgi:hypothetical protein